MSKKTSMGHNPLAYSLKNHASFDFIRNTQEQDKSTEEEDISVQKKVASYYLEESIVDEIRSIAEKENKSFSAVANEFLKQAMNKKEE
jgi:predicted DNA-binding ribbon-helix-helix protein